MYIIEIGIYMYCMRCSVTSILLRVISNINYLLNDSDSKNNVTKLSSFSYIYTCVKMTC